MESKSSLDKLAIAADQNVKERKYWLNKLAGDLIKSHFPYDYKKEGPKRDRGQRVKFEFPDALSAVALKLSGGVDAKLHMILVTGLFMVLNKYTGSEDLMIGSPILKQKVEGQFINTLLVFRNGVNPGMNFKELLLQVKETIVGANENQNYPMEILLHQLNTAAADEKFPLFDIGLLFENLHDRRYIEEINHSMLFSFSRTGQSIEGEVEYDSSLYRESTIEQIIDHYTHLLALALSKMDTQLSHLQMLSEQEKKKILLDFNNTGASYPEDRTLHGLFEEQVERTPDNVAVIGAAHPVGRRSIASGKMTVTYKELNKKSDRLAAVLIEKGVQPDIIVALMVEPSLEMMIGILGILKAGGAYLPIDSDYPEERIRFMLGDSGVGILLTNLSEGHRFNCQLSIVNYQLSMIGEAQPATRNSQPATSLAYIIYTSGTTGRPKGVMVEHRNVAAYLHAFSREFDFTSHHTVIQLASYAFDVFVEEVFPVLSKGGKIILPAGDEIVDIYLLLRLIVKYRVNVIDCTPLLLNEFNKEVHSLSSVHTFISGGDVLKEDYVTNLLKVGKVYNTYGPTESTVCAAYYHYTPSALPSIPIGKPIANYQIYILDKTLQLASVGVGGELCVGGPGVTRGYLNQPELTAERFIGFQRFNRSYRSYRTYIFYKTGDLARWLADGNIEFLGRIDDQVKIRGYRIETGEIENRLLKKNGIEEAVVLAKEDNQGEKYLCAYIVPGKEIELPGLRETLSADLPAYMIPSFFVPVDRIPLTANGKIDRKALPESDVDAGVEYVEPQNPIQDRVQRIWQEAFGFQKIGINDDFFSIGGHSLKGLQVINDIHKAFNIKVTLAEIFKTPTIKELAAYIEGAVQDEYISIEAVEKREYYALSSAQKRLYFLQQMDLESTAYNIPRVTPLHMKTDKGRLEQTFKKLIERHESLRSSFLVVDDEPVQRIHKDVVFELESHVAWSTEHGAWDRDSFHAPCPMPHASFIRPFDLSQAPLLRVGLFKEDEENHLLMLDMHHIITDEISQDILTNDFLTLYAGKELPPLLIQYKDYAQWHNRKMERDKGRKQEEYWLKEFEGDIPLLNLPTDYVRPEVLGFKGDACFFTIEPGLTGKIKKHAAQLEVTLMMYLLTVYNILISKYTDQEDIVVGTVIAGRNHKDLEYIIGFFVNMLAIRTRPNKNKTFTGFLAEVKEKVVKAFENQDYQFEELVGQLAIQRHPGRHPLVDTVFVLQDVNRHGAGTRTAHSSFGLHQGVCHFDLLLHATVTSDSIRMVFEYSTDLFKKSTIEEFSNAYAAILSRVVENQNDIRLQDIQIDINLLAANRDPFRGDTDDWDI